MIEKAEKAKLYKTFLVWRSLAQVSFLVSIFLLQLTSLSFSLVIALGYGWLHSLVNPLNNARNLRLGRSKKVLEVACLAAAFVTRFRYDPYRLLYDEASPYYMYYYTLLILATHQLYTNIKLFQSPSDLDFADMWSVILMESFVYWMPTDMMAMSSLGLCLATMGCRYDPSPLNDREGVIPDSVSTYLGFGLGAVTLVCPLVLLPRHKVNFGDEGMLGYLHSMATGLVLCCTLMFRWMANHMGPDTRMEEGKQVDPIPTGIRETVESTATHRPSMVPEAHPHEQMMTDVIRKGKEE